MVLAEADKWDVAEDVEDDEPEEEFDPEPRVYVLSEDEQAWLSRRAIVPSPDDFEDDEYMSAPALEEIVEKLIERHDMDAQHFAIDVVFKKKGGRVRGRETWGATSKLTGYAKFRSEGAQVVIWVAADHCSNHQITNYQLEAILFHELNHIAATVDEDGVPTLRIVDHDVMGFAADLREYGRWTPEYRRMSTAFEQAKLIPDEYIG